MSLEPRIIPCLLLQGEALVKTVKFADAVYVGDPVNVLSIFNDFEVDEIVLLDIAGARSRMPSPLPLLRHLAEECFIPMAYGGGLVSADEMGAVLHAGFEKVVLGTALADRHDEVRAAVKRFGSQAIVGAVDVRSTAAGMRAFVRGGAVDTGASPVEWASRAVDLGVGELLVTSIDREGTMSGFDLELVSAVAGSVDVPVIAHGGAAKRRQLAEPLRVGGASAVAAGSLFVFQGRGRGVLINYPPRDQIVQLLS